MVIFFIPYATKILTLVEIAIRDGLKAELHYKDIYRLCKDRVSDVLGQLLLK